MELEISTFKITQGGTTIELSATEAKELYKKLNDHFGMVFDFKSTSGFSSVINDGKGEFEFTSAKTTEL